MWIGVSFSFSSDSTFGLVSCMDFRHLILFQFQSHSFLSIHKSKWEPTNKPPTVIWFCRKERKIMPSSILCWCSLVFSFQFFNCTATPWRIPLPQHSFFEMSLFFVFVFFFQIFIFYVYKQKHLHSRLLPFKSISFSRNLQF